MFRVVPLTLALFLAACAVDETGLTPEVRKKLGHPQTDSAGAGGSDAGGAASGGGAGHDSGMDGGGSDEDAVTSGSDGDGGGGAAGTDAGFGGFDTGSGGATDGGGVEDAPRDDSGAVEDAPRDDGGAVEDAPRDDSGDSIGAGGHDGGAGGDSGSSGGQDGGTGGTADAGCKCGPCQRCGANSVCEINPLSRWELLCSSASVSRYTPRGDAWDRDSDDSRSSPDPFCQFESIAGRVDEETTGVTATLDDTLTPVWNQRVSPDGKTIFGAELMNASARWLLWVGDDDGCVRDECSAQQICQLRPPLQSQWLKSGGVTVQNTGSCKSLTLKFVCKG